MNPSHCITSTVKTSAWYRGGKLLRATPPRKKLHFCGKLIVGLARSGCNSAQGWISWTSSNTVLGAHWHLYKSIHKVACHEIFKNRKCLFAFLVWGGWMLVSPQGQTPFLCAAPPLCHNAGNFGAGSAPKPICHYQHPVSLSLIYSCPKPV